MIKPPGRPLFKIDPKLVGDVEEFKITFVPGPPDDAGRLRLTITWAPVANRLPPEYGQGADGRPVVTYGITANAGHIDLPILGEQAKAGERALTLLIWLALLPNGDELAGRHIRDANANLRGWENVKSTSASTTFTNLTKGADTERGRVLVKTSRGCRLRVPFRVEGATLDELRRRAGIPARQEPPTIGFDPPSAQDVIGREETLKPIDEALRTSRFVVLAGRPDEGKTSVLAKWVATRRATCTWVDLALHGRSGFASVVRKLLRLSSDKFISASKPGEDPRSAETLALVQRVFEERASSIHYLVLDGYERRREPTPADFDYDSLDALASHVLAAVPNLRVLIATTRPSECHGIVGTTPIVVPMRELSHEETRRLLVRAGRPPRDDKETARMQARSHGHPRFLAVLANRVADARTTDALVVPGATIMGGGWFGTEIVARLTPTERRILELISVSIAGSVPHDVLFDACARDDAEFAQASLEDQRFLGADALGHATCWSAVAEYLGNGLTHAERAARNLDLGRAYREAAEAHDDRVLVDLPAWAEYEHRAFHHFDRAKARKEALQAAHAVDDALHRGGYWDLSLKLGSPTTASMSRASARQG